MAELISMTDFVLEQKETETLDTSQIMWYDKEVDKLVKIRNYALFLKQPLEIWMFMPCKLINGVWVVLEEPIFEELLPMNEMDEIYKEYQQAKSLCLFEVYSFESESENFWYFGKDELTLIAVDISESIESLVEHKLTLTPAAEKQIGL